MRRGYPVSRPGFDSDQSYVFEKNLKIGNRKSKIEIMPASANVDEMQNRFSRVLKALDQKKSNRNYQ
jgi:hypothetical protein